MMGEINDDWRNELDISGLSLMDEDDSLLFSSSFPTDAGKEDRGLDLFGDICNYNEEEEVMQPREESSEIQKVMKYNLRKSLAWDKAFFTNAGVLEPDELSNMIESNHVGEKKVLGTIQEDVKRSTESISTLKSDYTVETSQEDCVLFEDVRASIQSSGVSTDCETPDKSKELGEREAAAHSPTPSTLEDPSSNEKMKPNAIRKKPSIRAQGLGKVTKQAVAAKEHNTSISRPSTGHSKSVRALVDVKEPLTPRVTISRRIRPAAVVSKPGVPSKSALRSSSSVASRNELMTSSCSSLESCISASSSASKKSPLESAHQKKKKAQSSRIASNSLANGSTSRAASKLISQSRVSPLSASSTYKPRLSSNASFLSASVDWSFNSPRASTPNKMGKGKKKTLSGGSSPAADDTKALKYAKDIISAVQDDPKRSSVLTGGTTLSSGSMAKPTRLRVPSPKLGYFDGVRSSVARTTPTGSCTGPVSGSAKHGARSLNESTTCSRTKSLRLIQESTNPKAKARPVSRSSRLTIVSASPKVTNKTYSKVSAEERLNGNEVEDII